MLENQNTTGGATICLHSFLTIELLSTRFLLFSPRMMGAEMLLEGGPLPRPGTELLSNTQKWIVRGDTCADKAKNFIGKGHPGREQQGKGTQENCFAMWLTVLGFMVMS